ncbi:MAG: DUF1800 domain-containing protein [Pseudomonadota bacterium]|nr:MAG: DUF1800 domain-containing protein [Pseudomonadota bacterium]
MAASATQFHPATTSEIVRLVDRITFGASRPALEQAESMGYEAFIDWQLDNESIDDGPLEALLAEHLPTLFLSTDELAELVRDSDNPQRIFRELVTGTLIRQAFSQQQLYQRMVEFWSDHFSVAAAAGVSGLLKAVEDREVIRPLAMGRFERLLQADARSPAMLYYLDNFNSTAEGPNENYARELLELHTLGVDGGYSEADIKETARIFTGWTIRRPASFRFNPRTHDWGAKHVLGHHFAPAGEAEGTRLLNVLASHQATARHIATKLARRFVADQPPEALIEDVVDEFLASGGNTRAVLRRLLLHPITREQPALKLRRPNEFVLGVLRSLEARPDGRLLRELFEGLRSAGHVPFAWPAPDGYPDVSSYWQSTTGFLMRFNGAAGWSRRLGLRSAVLREAMRINDPPRQTEHLIGALVPEGLAPERRAVLDSYAESLPSRERPIAVAAWLLASPTAQWR